MHNLHRKTGDGIYDVNNVIVQSLRNGGTKEAVIYALLML